MDQDVASLYRLDRLVWSAIALVAMTMVATPLVTDFRVAWQSFAVPAGGCAVLAAGAWYYRRQRCDVRLASALGSTAQLVAFTAVGAPLSYLAASAGRPLHDSAFMAFDQALGFDWRAWLAFMNGHPQLHQILEFAYASLTLQMTAVVLCLAFTGRLAWLRVYTIAFISTALITIAISAVLPAVGVWPHLGLTASDSPHVLPTVNTSWPVFYGLRDGAFRDLVAVGAEGIVTFPSLHAALAIVLIAALWPVPWLRYVALAVNFVMLASTPIDGSHYLSDIIAGVVIAALCIIAASMLVRYMGSSFSAYPATPAQPPPIREQPQSQNI